MAKYRIIDLNEIDFWSEDDVHTFDIDDNTGNLEQEISAEEALDFILSHPDGTFAFGEFEVNQAGAVSRMETIYGVSR